MYYKLLTALILLILVLIFIFQNTQMVTIEFLAWRVETARGVMALVILLIGVIIGWLGRGQWAHRKKR
ncbi:LapA family protein [Thiohalorhabdus sp.]|uniref:LapA family protein n=1 Tax=Thiohalorhabdus sp. TaxID=3094134 RepID=UPI002FC3A627